MNQRFEQTAALAVDELAPERIQWVSWRSLLVFASTGAMLFLLIRELVGTDSFVEALRVARWEYLVVPFGLTVLSLVIAAARWKVALRAMGYDLPLGRGIGACLSTNLLEVLVPSRAGDLMRAVAVRDVAPPMAGVGSILADRLIDIQSLCIYTIVGTAIHGLWSWAAIAASLLGCEWTCVLLLMRFRMRFIGLPVLQRFRTKLLMVISAFDALRAKPAYLLTLSLTSLGAWLVALATAYACLRVTGANLPWLTVMSLWPIATFATIAPISTAGLGTRDAAFAYLVISTSSGPVDSGPIVLATIVYSLLTSWVWGVIGLPWTIRMLSMVFARPERLAPASTA